MRPSLIAPLVIAAALVAPAAHAALAVGAAAPDLTADAAVGGKTFSFKLAEALKNGPVVLYFYPKSFTQGCTVEAHSFAEATPHFKELGASVIGISNDTIQTQQKFSTEECRNAFPVAADAGGKVMRAYDTVLAGHPELADRISYLIAPDGHVASVYATMSPDGHVNAMMKALEALQAAPKK